MIPKNWSPIIGCSAISPGCLNCYATAPGFATDGLTQPSKRGPVWTGVLRLDAAAMSQPLDQKEPSGFIVCPHGDLFHERAEAAWIDAAFDVMEQSTQHAFNVLTKRAARMREHVNARYIGEAPPHIALGVSVERQNEAEERIPELFAARAASRFLTLFPLIGPINLLATCGAENLASLTMVSAGEDPLRPAEPAWFASIAADCANAGVPYYRNGLEAEVAARGF